MSLLECVEYIGKITGKEPVVEFEKERLGDLLYFVCNTAKAEKELQWSPPDPARKPAFFNSLNHVIKRTGPHAFYSHLELIHPPLRGI